ncbi:hypothetical protein QR680_005366 [Steinernema hermaphroditum]|uniref:Uncharacterized protein n=1 Tax=Steinernema hermaphroditum TaxID=289476 RepID=A0AA39HTZ0_9BILA|nr:hypothetical protein QR680_005366 [Steinernema hermaphroditum]
MWLHRLLLLGALLASALGNTRLFKYGENNGDQELTHSLTSSALQLQVPIKFYEQVFDDFYISPLGAVSFEESLDESIDEALENSQISAIAPLFARSNGGKIFYRSTSGDDELLADMTSRIGRHFSGFRANHALLVTWEDMTRPGGDEKNTFQLGVATDGESSYVFLLYANVEWVEANDQYAQAGFYHSDGRHQLMINSGTANFVQMSRTSNINSDGVFLYRISGEGPEDPRNENDDDDDDYNYNDYDYEAVDNKNPPVVNPVAPAQDNTVESKDVPQETATVVENQPQEPPVENNDVAEVEPVPEISSDESIAHAGTCAQTSEPCNSNAECVDHENGFCCQCQQGFYGNGKECLREDETQRITGFLSAVINGKELSHDSKNPNMYHYVRVEQNQAYTAISSVSEELGQQLMILYPLGSIMGWLFASSKGPETYNGFDLTGGVFNRSVTIHLGESYTVTIRQQFLGRHIHEYDKIKSVVTGTLPEVPEGSEVHFEDHEDEYRREGSGYVRSYSVLGVRIQHPDGQHENLQMSVDQLIQYKECPFKTFDKTDTLKVRNRGANGKYDAQGTIVRFGMEYSSDEEEPTHQHQARDPYHQPQESQPAQDPCASGEHLCHQPNMRCQVEAHSYRCVCDRGFSAVANASAPVGYSCADLDECARGDHNCDRNAECRNLPGTFECVCREGFFGDGYFCEGGEGQASENVQPDHGHQQQQETPAQSPQGSGCTTHQECHQWGECVFGQHGQPGYCKCRGWYVGDGVTHCGPPEENIQPQQPQPQPQPEHRVEEASCGGVTCDPNADCNPSPSGGYECVCRAGYHGNGLQCESLSSESQPQQEEADQCYSHEECGENAYCKLIPELEVYQCACRERHSRVGGACVRDHEDECYNHEMCGENGYCHYNREDEHYQCRCREGTEKIGGVCQRPTDEDDEQDYEEEEESPQMCHQFRICHADADCVYKWNSTLARGVFGCRCRPGFSGDGLVCSNTFTSTLPQLRLGTPLSFDGDDRPFLEPGVGCDTLFNCDRNAHCVFNPSQNRHVCQCASGFHGDGYRCASESSDSADYDHQEDERLRQEEEERRRQHQQQQFAPRHQCRDAKDCHHNGHCVIDERSNAYVCECLPGFSGDGRDQCQTADRCNPSQPGSCPQNSECVLGEVERAFVCKCVTGFSGDGHICRPHGASATCDENPNICHSNAQCVFIQDQGTYGCICKPGSFGDGYTECTPKDVPRCGKCSTNARCIQNEETEAWSCQCNPGFQGNGLFCQPMTSCLDNRDICDEHAECVPGVGGHYVCNCKYGYHGNGRTCSRDSDSRSDTLLISRGMSIIQRGTNVDVPGKHLVILPHQTVIDIEVDCQGDRIYWSDASGHSLRSSSMNGTNLQSYLADVLKFPEGVAIDWASRNIYYSDSVKDVIGVASLDGKMHKTLLSEGLVNPRDLTIDLDDRRLYYADWNRERPIIGRMDLDGSNNEVFLEEDIQLPNGIVIVHSRHELCWLDAGTKQLSCIGTDGRNRRTVYAPLEHPFGLTIHNEQRFYWTDWKDKRVHSVSIYGQGYTSFATSIGTSANLFGITAVNKQCPGAPTSCANNNGGCSHLCLPGRTSVKCVCPDNADC